MEEVPKEGKQKELGAGAGLREGWAGRKEEDARGHCQPEERPEAGGEAGGPRAWQAGVVQGLPGCRGDPASGRGGLLAEHRPGRG